ncbi:creatininase [Hyaloraphidium curvatum]|nr:creatininase [Hyaloraphidium curvatum]
MSWTPGCGRPRRWDLMTSSEIGAMVSSGMDCAVLPVGATEQHGAHLATGCDTLSPESVAWLASARTGVPVLPAIPYGISVGHRPGTGGWPGTITVSCETLIRLVVEVARGAVASGITRLIFLNGNGPNVPPLECARIQLRGEFPDGRFRVISLFDLSQRVQRHYFSDALDIHANRGETSLLMHLVPEAVRPELVVDEDDVTPDLVFSYDMLRTTRSGVVGKAREASAEDGKVLADMLVDDFAALLERAVKEEWPKPPGPK